MDHLQLAELRLVNFRSFMDETIAFDKRLSVIVGENNGGKSNIIDAIRLITAPLNGRRDLYCDECDVRFGSQKRCFEIEALYRGLSAAQQGRLLSATVDDSMSSVKFGVSFDASKGGSHPKPTIWAGRFRTAPEAGCRDMLRHVYLPPLRDARHALASGNPTRINILLNHFLEDRKAEDVAKELGRKGDHSILQAVNAAVAVGLDALTIGVRRQSAALGFGTDEKLIDIARDLRFVLADHGIPPEELRYSGHGFANLLYMATIAVELEKVDDADLTLFLVEEPEAHLHPQLQAAVLAFLEERIAKSLNSKADVHAPAGHLQVIVATHSPNLSAWVEGRHLIFVRSVLREKKKSEGEASNEVQTALRWESRCVSLAQMPLAEKERRKIDRYLDVTKSALLFGGRVLLVEGIAEALLLPVIARDYVLKEKQVLLKRFKSVVFVPIDGVDFLPYIKMLLGTVNNNGVRIADRVVILTDGDKHLENGGTIPAGVERRRRLMEEAKGLGAANALNVIINTFSLEAELVLAGNTSIIKDVYLELHPRSEDKWEAAVALNGVDRGRKLQSLFENIKGDFAQLLAERISTRSSAAGDTPSDPFIVPKYIEQAIEAVVR